MEKVLVTGTAGFIGFHLTRKLLSLGYEVVGLDCVNDYYDINLKFDRLAELGIKRDEIVYNKKLEGSRKFSFIQLRLEDRENIQAFFVKEQFEYVVALAAQAGVRYSLDHPFTYIDSNITGFLTILEGCRHNPVKHLIYASSSSVYGLNEQLPFSVADNVDHPISLYAASKKADELMAHTYSHLFKVPTSGLRFFTVYGPWGRPDMALFIFTKNIIEGKPIQVFNNGEMQRDFTYVDDITESISRLLPNAPKADPAYKHFNNDPSASSAPYRVYNIGNSAPVKLMDYIGAIEEELGVKAQIEFLPMQPGDVTATFADVTSLTQVTGFKPKTNVLDGIRNFIRWYKEYYKVNVEAV